MGQVISDKDEPSVQVTIVELEAGLPRPLHTKSRRIQQYFSKLRIPLAGQRHDRNSTKRNNLRSCASLLRRSFRRRSDSDESPWPKLVRHGLYLLTGIVGLATIAILVYHSLLLDLARRLSPPKAPNTGLSKIVSSWTEPGTTPSPPFWLPDFSRGIYPKQIHSHNDYWRPVPLFQALSLGVTGIEADVHLINNDLIVGHSRRHLRPDRTFRSLYLDPLVAILTNQNEANNLTSDFSISGVWDTDTSAPIILMTDLKTDGATTLGAVQIQLQPLREKGWLTYWNGSAIVPGPIIHVGTGNTPFPSVINSTFANETYRDVFFDAPLTSLTRSQYNVSNSYYASTSLRELFPGIAAIGLNGLNKAQIAIVKAQIQQARDLGLVSRYWDVPTWPVGRRMRIWRQLEDLGVGILSVDEVEVAARWNWRWCGVLGLSLC